MDASLKRAADVTLWILLLTMPYWMAALGGYTSLGSRVLALALAASHISASEPTASG